MDMDMDMVAYAYAHRLTVARYIIITLIIFINYKYLAMDLDFGYGICPARLSAGPGVKCLETRAPLTLVSPCSIQRLHTTPRRARSRTTRDRIPVVQ